ncbi:MAG: hypothetical protein QXV69_09435 [Sulfolobaceae archaeon]
MVKIRYGLSEVIGFFIVLIIIVAIALPLLYYVFYLPTSQSQQISNSQSIKNLALEQYKDFQPIYFFPKRISRISSLLYL